MGWDGCSSVMQYVLHLHCYGDAGIFVAFARAFILLWVNVVPVLVVSVLLETSLLHLDNPACLDCE